MLDIHATHGTPGNVTVALLTELGTICTNDGASVAGVPIADGARLIMWGGLSLIANTISAMQLQSQDQIDPINGETINLGALSLENEFHKFTNLPYRTGKRILKMSTNTAQADSNECFTMDWYDQPAGMAAPNGEARFKENQITLVQLQGAADVANGWYSQAIAPAVAIPNGKYAILGVYATLMTEAHVVRFAHSDFGGKKPGFPIVPSFNSDILGHQKGIRDILQANPGFQFVALAEATDKACIPVFNVTNAGTGLNLESLASAVTDTPSWQINLAKVG
jgi:hypothetical protein